MTRAPEGEDDERPSRRTVLKLALAAGGVAGLSSLGLCARDRFCDSEAAGFDSLPFDVWRRLRDAVRESPDHLVARADTLVEAGDAEALFRFVRDEIATYPSGDSDFTAHNTTVVRWGAAAALRGGAGTPREKADLLAALLTRAGHKAEVVDMPYVPEESAIQALLAVPERSFAPQVTKSELRQWRKVLGLSASAPPLETFDHGGEEARAVAERYLGALPAAPEERWHRARAFAMKWRARVASVRLEHADGQRLLTPLAGHESRAEDADSGVKAATEARGLLDVEVALQAATTTDAKNRFDLVVGTWTADQLIGRQLIVQTLPACYPENWGITRFCDVHAFVPLLTVQDPQRAKDADADTVIVGQAISAEGERIEVAADGSLLIGENRLSPSASTSAAKVARIEIEVQADAFPRVDVKATAYDAAGATIEGLSAADFATFDDDKPVAHLLLADREAPRVAVLVDQSGSMPGAYRGREMDTFYDGLETVLREVSPHAILLRRPTDSNLWTNLAKGAVDAPAFIVYITDGDVYDTATPEILARLARGPRALLIGVREGRGDVLQAMADATRGQAVFATEAEDIHRAIAEMLSGHSEPSYRLRYTAAHRDAGTHVAKLKVPAAKSEASGPYQVPGEPARAPQLAGLYLRIKIGREEYIRTLVGHDHHTPSDPIQPESLAKVRAAMFGTTIVGFEAAAPPTSVWLDDLLTARLSIEPAHEQLVKGDALAARAALHEHFRYLPADLCQTLMLGLPQLGEQAMTYQTGLRVGIYQERASFHRAVVHRQIDLLPSAGFRTAHADIDTACTITARRTARLAIAERARFDHSTLAVLDGASLGVLTSAALGDIEELDTAQRNRWREQMRDAGASSWLVGPERAVPMSYMRIDKTTGAMLAMLPDGTGGGQSQDASRYGIDEMMTLTSHLNAHCAQAGTAVLLGLLDSLEQLLAGHARAVTVISQIIDAAVDVRTPLQSFVCTATRGVLFGATGVELADRSKLDPLLAVLIEDNAHGCIDTTNSSSVSG